MNKDNIKEEENIENDAQEATVNTPDDQEIKQEEKVLSTEEVLEEKLTQEKDRYVRLFAEFENFKRRTAKERIDQFKTANQKVMVSLLPILDDFDRALNEIRKSDDEIKHFEGVELILSKMKESLRKEGLEVMKVKAGDKFDSDLHEAITQIPAPKKKLKGKIIDVIEKGYMLGDKIIRYPKVVTGK